MDLGGGDGLLCRFLRDRGLNGFVRDRYASPTYAQGFDKPDFDCADLVTAFEVFEHLPEPRTDLHEFFSQRPPILLASTTQYTGQGPEWWYISPESGQHVFFYSRLALERVARDYGYRAEFCGDFILYVRLDKDIAWRRRVAFLLLKPRSLKLVAASLMLGPTTGAAADFALMRQRAARIQALAAARTDIRK